MMLLMTGVSVGVTVKNTATRSTIPRVRVLSQRLCMTVWLMTRLVLAEKFRSVWKNSRVLTEADSV